MTLRKVTSEGDLNDLNPNTNWVHKKGAWTAFVVGLCVAYWAFTAFFGFSPATAWTIIITIHTISTFYGFHWALGSPLDSVGNENVYKLTWWEQLDNGAQWTASKKFLTVVPIALFLIAYPSIEAHSDLFWYNAFMTTVLVMGKMPFMHRIRILGINNVRREHAHYTSKRVHDPSLFEDVNTN
uniref:Uncharacterized protein n=1 Tax=Palpitomonas bilix TaxID=652834 RepID=A0A7S3DHP2_9EUKA|mmetsp:Transcript_37686/g.97219  ORF Transcript_37686/g.97219 Transcript_37686/m.97219 type:complete len:183 (+) Transcript_37686:149-697(+)|eukprot:CAMPEP_0113897946 /NCGR_PEP_ID=MMETSP0780_2-20120614/19035_1 /TAXON_ID=652834 /ORGANISM="Palpitomonas bilix" /LENGTH=182 /DNA_ID=CAMNT_0000889613 /DNA_START=57 /DNA_END=605 /DNA_ORIENTATION=- /assembly_acc=CAM_ASM_000599